MRKHALAWLGLLLGLTVCTGAGVEAGTPALDEHLQVFAPFVERTWQGSLVQPEGPPMIDVSRWETALGGKAVRVVHSLNQGVYGGETIIFWDQGQKSLAFYYFTTAGFYTHGTLEATEDGFAGLEIVENNEQGITQVRSTSRILPDGRLHARSEYLKNGEWVPGHEFYYVEAPDAEVVFNQP